LPSHNFHRQLSRAKTERAALLDLLGQRQHGLHFDHFRHRYHGLGAFGLRTGIGQLRLGFAAPLFAQGQGGILAAVAGLGAGTLLGQQMGFSSASCCSWAITSGPGARSLADGSAVSWLATGTTGSAAAGLDSDGNCCITGLSARCGHWAPSHMARPMMAKVSSDTSKAPRVDACTSGSVRGPRGPRRVAGAGSSCTATAGASSW
jgi:hypothetical protein